jgi:hypothetical protein
MPKKTSNCRTSPKRPGLTSAATSGWSETGTGSFSRERKGAYPAFPGRRLDRGRPARENGDRHAAAGATASLSPFSLHCANFKFRASARTRPIHPAGA